MQKDNLAQFCPSNSSHDPLSKNFEMFYDEAQ